MGQWLVGLGGADSFSWWFLKLTEAAWRICSLTEGSKMSEGQRGRRWECRRLWRVRTRRGGKARELGRVCGGSIGR